jgi:phosphate transport system substrate-binding protein
MIKTGRLIMAGTLAALAALSAASTFAVELDKTLPVYVKVQGVGGNLDSIGSDTLNNLMTFWAEGFRALYPNVHIQIEGKGSSTAPPALISGTAQLGPMSRMMKSTEIDEFEKKYGFKPTAIGVGLDSLAVYVNKDNPLTSLTLPQIDAVFSKTRSGGYPADLKTWGALGLKDTWAALPLSLYGRNSASGTYAFFKETALFKGDFKDSVKEQPGSASVVMGISEDKQGIGYSGIGYKTSGVKTLAIAESAEGEAFEPTYENVLSSDYPLGRMLYVYIAKDPKQPLNPVTREFLKYVLSRAGQEVVLKDGYLPLPAKLAEKQMALLD